MAECSIAVFDLGGVLIDGTTYLYRKLLMATRQRWRSFSTVCTQSGTSNRTLVARLPMLLFTEAGSSA